MNFIVKIKSIINKNIFQNKKNPQDNRKTKNIIKTNKNITLILIKCNLDLHIKTGLNLIVKIIIIITYIIRRFSFTLSMNFHTVSRNTKLIKLC